MSTSAATPWLPDLCRPSRLAVLFGVAEMVVLVVALAPDGGAPWNLSRFVSGSGFALWLALTVAVLLCVARGPLSRLPRALGGVLALVLGALVAAGGAALLYVIDDNLGTHLVPDGVTVQRFAFGSAALTVLVLCAVLPYLHAVDAWRSQVQASARAEADALQARIRPHFLFNSMNTIASLVRRDPATAERAVLDLSDLFRAALQAGEVESSLAEEVELAERYLAIEALRLGERLRVEWQRDGDLPWKLPLPRLVLQPLVENAVVHGVARLPEGGTIQIALGHADGTLLMRVRNPAPPQRERDGGGAGHAQRSIGHRLAYTFGPRARMAAGWEDGYYQCELRVPTDAPRRGS